MYVRFRKFASDEQGILFGPADTVQVQRNTIVAGTRGSASTLAHLDGEVWQLATERSDAPGFPYVEILTDLPPAFAKPIPNR